VCMTPSPILPPKPLTNTTSPRDILQLAFSYTAITSERPFKRQKATDVVKGESEIRTP
jgi:hypothetical protein